MSWALFLNADGKPEVDFYAFARGKGIISEHATRPEANEAKAIYLARQEREALAAAGQKELF